MVSRVLVIGDLHTKIANLEKAIKTFEDEKFDKVIFLGDYVDDWNTPPEASRNVLVKLLEFKYKYKDKCILLLGNHDLSEWLGTSFKCSGYNGITHMIVRDIFYDNEDCFQMAYEENNYIFTHAGIHNQWLKDISLLDDKFKNLNAKSIVKELNYSLKLRYEELCYNQLFESLNSVGGYRGGFSSPSPIWADYHELISNPMPHVNQIVGHTPVKKIILHTIKRGDERDHLFFCDTQSTYTNGENIGDNSFLKINLV